MSVLLLLLALSALPAQQEQRAAGTATLLPGLGRTHHEIATRSDEAQKFFDQGLTLVYGFNHDEAIRAFRRAAELDPASPMPLWGVALALGPNINLDVDPVREQEAHETAQRALRLASNAPAAERAYAGALVKRYSNDPKADLKVLAVEYKDAMRDLSQQYPDDLDAATLYAESLICTRGSSGRTTANRRRARKRSSRFSNRCSGAIPFTSAPTTTTFTRSKRLPGPSTRWRARRASKRSCRSPATSFTCRRTST